MNRILAAAGPLAPLVVFLLAAGESAAFVGFVLPGELAVILGGVLAGTGRVALWVMVAAAVAGAVVGDSIGYRLGNRLGPTLVAGRPRVQAHLERAATLVAERGWWSLVVARFAAVLRAVVPFAAGMGKMPYPRFLLGNALGGVLWGVTFTLVGYLAGANYPTVERWFRTGGLAVAAVAVLIGGIAAAGHWAARHPESVSRWGEKLASRPPVRWLVAAARASNRPLVPFILTGAGTVAAIWLFAGLIQDVLGSEEFFFFDLDAVGYLDRNRVSWLVAAARTVDLLADPRLLVGISAVAVLVWAVRDRRVAVAWVAALTGQWVIAESAAALVSRTPPAVAPLAARVDYGFPSEAVALVTALVLLAAWPWRRPGWRRIVVRFTAAALAVAAVAAARVILLVEYPSDVLAGAAAAAAWTLPMCLAARPSQDKGP